VASLNSNVRSRLCVLFKQLRTILDSNPANKEYCILEHVTKYVLNYKIGPVRKSTASEFLDSTPRAQF
jgi:hypothetical protein